MFKNLTNLSYKRAPLEAAGFYITYFLLLGIVCAITAGAIGFFAPTDGFQSGYQQGAKVGAFMAVILCPSLAFAVLIKKKQLGSFLFIIAALLAGIFALFLGGLLGLIPVAFLTTLENKS